MVLNWNDRDSTTECLRSLRQIEYPDFVVLVVDNGSSDGSLEWLRDNFTWATFIENGRNLGCSGGFNVGILRAIELGAEYVVCLNNDTRVEEQFLTELVGVGEVHPSAGALCPKEYSFFEPNRIVYAGGSNGLVRRRNRGFGEVDIGQYDEVMETDMLCGAAMVLRSSALLNVGLLDSSFFFDWEDKDISARLLRQGYTLLYVPAARIWHKGRWSSRGVIAPFRVYFNVRNGLRFAKKHYSVPKRVLFALTFLPMSVISALANSHDRLAGVKAIVLAIAWHLNPRYPPPDHVVVESLSG